MKNSIEIVHPREEKVLRIINNTQLVPSAKPRKATIGTQTREELIRLVQRLFLSPNPEGPRVVLFSGVEQGSGCSWTCARTAEILADRTDGLVCLIDANFRSPSLYREFDFQDPARACDQEWTFAPVTRSGIKTHETNLWLLSYRPLSVDCPTPASMRGFQARISDLRHDFDYVLIDAPPLNGFADATLFGPMTDGLVMVVEANSTRREPAKKARQMLDESGVPILGAVLNKRSYPIPERLYRRL